MLSLFNSIHCVLLSFLIVVSATLSAQTPQWEQLPPTPELPKPDRSGLAAVNGIHIWYAVFGHGSPVILVHGGNGNSNYWGFQIPALAGKYEVIVLDSRGHGRSTRNSEPITYDLMATDVLALMNMLHIAKAALVGWSDGGIIGLDIAINHPERLTKLFAFGANCLWYQRTNTPPSMLTGNELCDAVQTGWSALMR